MADTDNSILLVDQMVERYWDILPMRELILDNGSQFGAHRRGDNKEWDSRFKWHVESFGIKLIPTSIKHPQTNGWEDREVLRLLQQVQREVILRVWMRSSNGTTQCDPMRALIRSGIFKRLKRLSGADYLWK